MKHPIVAVEAAVLSVIALTAPHAAHAAPATLSNGVFHERDGAEGSVLAPAAKVIPGDRVVYVLTYHNGGDRPQSGVVISNPLPANVEYAGPRDGAPPQTSVDGGKSFGSLSSLSVVADAGTRPAGMADVTALRWTLSDPVPPGGDVRVSYRARLK